MTKEREAPTVDLQPELDRKNADLDARLRLIEKQAADQAAKFPPAPEPKAKK